MEQRRLIPLLVFLFSLVMLWEAWLRHNQPVPQPQLVPQLVSALPQQPPQPVPVHWLQVQQLPLEELLQLRVQQPLPQQWEERSFLRLQP